MPRYILYARKSTESEDRQVLSIDSQVQELKTFAHEHGLQVAAVLQEARSARAPGRPVFGDLLGELNRRKAQGILCWKLDRLARNPVDGGALIWAFDQGKLAEIATPQRSFTNTGNDKFWMQLEFGMAKKYVDDLSDNVKRGLRAKLAQGWLPGLPRLGYRNDPVARTIVKDPERFPLVRRIFDAILAGTTPSHVLDLANTAWGLRTRRFKHRGDRPLSRSAFYALLSDPFYYGLIVRQEGAFPGQHDPMLTKDEFDRVQEILGRPNRPHEKRHVFAFTGLIRCGQCGGSITAEHKTNRYGSRYTYYHCTHNRAGRPCAQRVIRAEALEAQIVTLLGRIALPEPYRQWAITHLRAIDEREATARQTVEQSLRAAIAACETKLRNLTELQIASLLSRDEYAAKRQDLVGERVRLTRSLDEAQDRAATWRAKTERVFVFADEASRRFATGSRADKREILLALGSNPTLRDGILSIPLEKPFQEIATAKISLGHESEPIEPANEAVPIDHKGGLATACTVVYGVADAIRTFFLTAPDTIPWPQFCIDATIPEGLQESSSSLASTVASGKKRWKPQPQGTNVDQVARSCS